MVEVSDTALEPIGDVHRTRIGREATEPMRADIRLLGAILGDTVREQNGDEVFELVERARVEAFRVRHSEIDRAEMARMFEGIDIHHAIPIIRALPSYQAILAQPPGAVSGSLRLTEQGEVIAAKYAEPQMARRNLESLLAATLESTLLAVEGLGDTAAPAYAVLDEVAALAQRAYAELVHETPGFVEYFKASTPVSEFGALNIGSRPTSRKPTASIADLRAIPWVLAWSQSRVMLPGWYGTGSAFEQWLAAGPESEADRLQVLHDLYQRWPFFRSVLSNMAQVMAKSDLELAARYSELVADETLRRRVFDKIADEHHRTIAMYKRITGQDDLLADNPALARSVFNRFPYLEPLNHLQVELLRRYRSGEDDESVQRGILLTMNGLASALRNSG